MRFAPLIAALVAALAGNVAGQTVSPELTNVKFIAGLFWASANGLNRRCAATIISNNTLVTSASCAMSDYPTSAYGAGEWRIVAGNTDDRFLETTGSDVTGYSVANVDIDKCADFAIIQLSEPMDIGSDIQTIILSSHEIDPSAQLYTFNTSDTTGNPFLSLSQGNSDACSMLRPGYADDYFICTQPVQNQYVTGDYLGGDPIIGFSNQPQSGTIVALVGVTGMYYSTIASAQHGEMNDPTAYRFNPMVAPQVDIIAGYAGVDPTSIITTGDLN
ncbi:hypothetical protein LPJ59_005707 [Coemansia sp. RSA 2399]|nr:hypothetical protein LPJ59_005707 [Coemansia sp. RSA 2399]KAJ1892273.1 hypothetical protein LPJ81_005588 [Coemansia sp. IMI 209127]